MVRLSACSREGSRDRLRISDLGSHLLDLRAHYLAHRMSSRSRDNGRIGAPRRLIRTLEQRRRHLGRQPHQLWQVHQVGGTGYHPLRRGALFFCTFRIVHTRLKSKHRVSAQFAVIGWRLGTPGKPAGLVLAEHDVPLCVATVALAAGRRTALADLLQRPGCRHPSGHDHHSRPLPGREGSLQQPHPTRGILREPAAVDLRAAGACPR